MPGITEYRHFLLCSCWGVNLTSDRMSLKLREVAEMSTKHWWSVANGDYRTTIKMLYLIGPDGLVNRRFINFQNMVWMTMVHVLRFRIKHTSMLFFWKFAYVRFTPYANNIRFSHEQNLKGILIVASWGLKVRKKYCGNRCCSAYDTPVEPGYKDHLRAEAKVVFIARWS